MQMVVSCGGRGGGACSYYGDRCECKRDKRREGCSFIGNWRVCIVCTACVCVCVVCTACVCVPMCVYEGMRLCRDDSGGGGGGGSLDAAGHTH